MNNHVKMFCHKKFQGYMCICRNAEGVHGNINVWTPWFRRRWSPEFRIR